MNILIIADGRLAEIFINRNIKKAKPIITQQSFNLKAKIKLKTTVKINLAKIKPNKEAELIHYIEYYLN